jgi:hypothetical protein
MSGFWSAADPDELAELAEPDASDPKATLLPAAKSAQSRLHVDRV